MSAYIVNPENVSDILNHIRLEANNNRFYAPYRWLCDFGYDVCNPREFKNLYRRLWGMNFRAVYQRYGDHMDWTFSEIVYNVPSQDFNVIKIAELLSSFTYQCAEGAVYKEPLYDLMYRIYEFYKPLADDLEKEQAREQAKADSNKFASVPKLEKKEVAKRVKAILKEKYPDVKFSVTSGGHSTVTVEWQDGPTADQIKDLVGGFRGSRNDGYYNRTHYTIDPITEEEIYCYNDYISFNRGYSEDTLEIVWQNMLIEFGDLLNYEDIVIKGDDRFSFKNPNTPLYGPSGNYHDTTYYIYHKRLSEYSCGAIQSETQSEESDSGVQYGEYKGHATITLPYGNKGFSFGVTKAQAIIEYLEEIKKFVEENK